jgi:2-keto-3-deoxy-L-fuconate dehydrogenase
MTGTTSKSPDWAHAIAYLPGPAAGSTTGTDLAVDGGMSGLRVRQSARIS